MTNVIEPLNLVKQLNQQLSATVAQVQESLVQIHNGRHGNGAGIIWHADGLIITNAHVVRREQGLKVTLPDGETVPAQVLAYDKKLDLAALSIVSTNLSAITLGDSRQLQPGQWVTALGHPWGVKGAASSGVVIDVGLPPEMSPGGSEFVQVGLQLRPGHSGGPLVDVYGHLVGINTMITGPEVGLAVPVHVVKSFLRRELGEPEVVFV